MTEDVMLRNSFARLSGARLKSCEKGSATASVTLRPEHAGANGTAHGGLLTTLMDSSLAIALRELRGEGASLHSSIEMNASFLAEARPGDELTIEARISHLGENVAFGEAQARRRADGELIAIARVTFAIQQP